MINEENAMNSIDIEFTPAIEMFRSEKNVRINLAIQVVNRLIRDAKNGDYSQYDEDGNPSYANSIRKKLYDLAQLFLDDSLCYEGISDSFHNLAVDYAGQNMFSEACIILERGLTLIPADIDLMADYLLYGSNIPERRTKCKHYFEKLKMISKERWTWRAYSFSIRYLLNEQKYVATSDEDEQIKQEAISIGKEYVKKYAGKNADHRIVDRAYSDLADIYNSYGEYSKAYRVLKECDDKYNKVPITSFSLAEIEFNDGKYVEASSYLTDSITSMEIRPSVNRGYVYLLRAYSDVSLLLTNEASTESELISVEQKQRLLTRLRNDLDTAREFMDDQRYDDAIDNLWIIVEKQFSAYEESGNAEW